MNSRIFSFVCGLVVLVSTTRPGLAQQDEIRKLKQDLAALQAQVDALKASIEILKAADFPINEGKWVRDLVEDLMTAFLTATPDRESKKALSNKFFTITGQVPDLENRWVEWRPDPNLTVKSTFEPSLSGDRPPYKPHAPLSAVFSSYEIESRDLAPSKDTIVIRGKLKGNKDYPAFVEKEAKLMPYRIVEGTPGIRTGRFIIRLAKDDKAKWRIVGLDWSVDLVGKQLGKK